MKLQISFDIPNLEKALAIAKTVDPFSSSFAIGSLLLYKYGITAIKEFRQNFPEKILLVDTKIVDRAKEVINLFTETRIDWITVLAGTSNHIIHASGTQGHKVNIKTMIDLIDARSLGQSALDAKSLDIDALLIHAPYDEGESLIFLDQFDLVRGNTNLPIWISGKITRDIIYRIININPDGIIIGKEITDAENPAQEAKFFYDIITNQEASSNV